MKLAFSSTGCPEWDVPTMINKAKEYGYDGIELAGRPGPIDESFGPEITGDPEKAAQLARDAGVEIVCLATTAAFHMSSLAEVVENQASVREHIDLAAKLGCPFVRVFSGEIPGAGVLGRERRDTVLARMGGFIRELTAQAAERRVTILVENSGDFVDSPSLWYLVDAADTPAVKCCWNPLAALARGEHLTRSIPRLAQKLGTVRVCDGKPGAVGDQAAPDNSDVDIKMLVQLLKGIAYRGYLVVGRPTPCGSAAPDDALPAAAEYIRSLLGETPIVMVAYKGDKYAPRVGYDLTAS